MANKLTKIIITGPLPLQACNQLRWAPSLGPQIYTLAPYLCRPYINHGGPQHWWPQSTRWPPSSAGQKTTKGGPSTGGPNQPTGPLPLQAGQHYGGPHHWRPKPTHWPPSSAGLKSTMVGPITGCPPNQHNGPLPLQAGNPLWWAPLLEAPEINTLAPFLCRPKSNTIGPTLQAEINYCWPHSAGQNQLLVAPLCRPKII